MDPRTVVRVRDTPYLVVDVARLERNLSGRTESARDGGRGPTAARKTHKSPEIARRQLAAGAVGITVATVGEAEVFVEHGVTDVFVAYPLWVDRARADRIRARWPSA